MDQDYDDEDEEALEEGFTSQSYPSLVAVAQLPQLTASYLAALAP